MSEHGTTPRNRFEVHESVDRSCPGLSQCPDERLRPGIFRITKICHSAFTRDRDEENAATLWSIHLTRDDESFKELKATSATLITGRRVTHAPFILARATALRARLDHGKTRSNASQTLGMQRCRRHSG